MTTVRGVRGQVFRTDIIRMENNIGPAYMQQDPVKKTVYYFNHWIGNINGIQ